MNLVLEPGVLQRGHSPILSLGLVDVSVSTASDLAAFELEKVFNLFAELGSPSLELKVHVSWLAGSKV